MTQDKAGYRKLGAWQRAEEFASTVFQLACKLPHDHDWLASDLTRTAISVPVNIAEGYAQESIGEYLCSLDVARGSLSRMQYYLNFMGQIGIVAAEDLSHAEAQHDEAVQVLDRLWQSLRLRESGFSDDDLTPGEPDGLYEADQ